MHSGLERLLTFDLCVIGLVARLQVIAAMVDDANSTLAGGTALPNVVVNVTAPGPHVLVQKVIEEVVKIRLHISRPTYKARFRCLRRMRREAVRLPLLATVARAHRIGDTLG